MPDSLAKQFEENPYPNIPIDAPVTNDMRRLYEHCVTNAFYARDREVVNPSRMHILDVGCGTGFRSLLLAEANPGAAILGIDWSEHSLDIAKRRRDHHRVSGVEFRRCCIADIGTLGMQFDYINCNDTLYLLPDPAEGLQSMCVALSPQGMIRADLHNMRQRMHIHRAQELFDRLGVMSGCSNEDAVAFARKLYSELHDRVILKVNTWSRKPFRDDTEVLANVLLRGDRGYTLSQTFSIIKKAGLQFVNLVDALRWNLDSLFASGVCEIERVLESIGSREDYYLIYDLLNFNGRLYDFWCCRPEVPIVSRIEWSDPNPTIHLHPVLRTGDANMAIEESAASRKELRIGAYVPAIGGRRTISVDAVSCIYPLLEGSKSLNQLAEHWQQLCPLHVTSSTAVGSAHSKAFVKNIVNQLERLGIVYVVSHDTRH